MFCPALRACFLAALVLRLTAAVVTEYRPIFPAYYYADVRLSEDAAQDMLSSWAQGKEYSLARSPSQRAHAFLLAVFYRVFGHHPLGPKLLHATAGAFAVAAFYYLARSVFSSGAALLSAWLIALWPSHIFFTSQSFKDSLVVLLSYAALTPLFRMLGEQYASQPPGALLAAACLSLLGFFRAYLMAAFCAVLGAALALRAAFHVTAKTLPRPALWGLTATIASPFLYLALSNVLYHGILRPSQAILSAHTLKTSVLPATFDARIGGYIGLSSARAISDTRRIRQFSDQESAQREGRRIGTQLFFGLEFRNWLDVLLFLPKGMFYVLFMPLPGLYPLENNLGRILASLENTALLILGVAALAGFWRSPKTPQRLTLACLFLSLAAGSALLEFDLGSATRHRLLYMPALFPFAFSLVCGRRRRAREGRLKVLQVLECGGPGGTGNQVAALCNNLDHELFEIGLVYATRPGATPQSYRKSAAGASLAFHLPELVREISPLSDFKALLKLYRIFQEQQPDVVHAHSSKAGALARPAAWLCGVPRIFYSPHGYGFLQQDRSSLCRGVYRLAEWSVSWIGTIIAVSPSEAELARALSWGRPVETVCDAYIGELPATGSARAHEGTLIGSCGRLASARQPQVWVNLAQRLTDSRNNVRCVWIGGGEQEAAVRRDLENMNMLTKVEVTGWLESAAVRRRLADLDIFVHYSRWDALPNAVLEAMAFGLPIVASDVPGCRDAVVHGETGLLAKNEVELLEFCHRLIDDPGLRRRFGEAGRRRLVERFSAAEALSRLQAFYRSDPNAHLI